MFRADKAVRTVRLEVEKPVADISSQKKRKKKRKKKKRKKEKKKKRKLHRISLPSHIHRVGKQKEKVTVP